MSPNPPPLRACPTCRWLSREDVSVCPHCGTVLRGGGALRRWWQRQSANGVMGSIVLLAVLVLIFVVTELTGRMEGGMGRVLFAFGSLSPAMVLREGEWWRMVTSIFLHGGLLHMLFNGWALYDLGRLCEKIYGTRRFWVVFMVTGIGGNLLSLAYKVVVGSPVGSVGASGAICGLMGLLIGSYYAKRGVSEFLAAQLKRWFIYIVVFGLIMWSTVDNAAHLGGAATGFLLAFLIMPVSYTRIGTQKDKLWTVGAWFCVVVALAANLTAWSRIPWSQLMSRDYGMDQEEGNEEEVTRRHLEYLASQLTPDQADQFRKNYEQLREQAAELERIPRRTTAQDRRFHQYRAAELQMLQLLNMYETRQGLPLTTGPAETSPDRDDGVESETDEPSRPSTSKEKAPPAPPRAQHRPRTGTVWDRD